MFILISIAFYILLDDEICCITMKHTISVVMTHPLHSYEAESNLLSIHSVREVHSELKALGCFEKVDIMLDISDSSEEEGALDVTVTVDELRWVSVGLEPRACDLSDLLLVARCGLPNLLGAGESLRAEAGRTALKGAQQASLSLAKQKLFSHLGRAALVLRAAWEREPLTWRRGCLTSEAWTGDLTFLAQPFSWLQDKLSVSVSLRDLAPTRVPGQSRASVPFSALRECGRSMKASAHHHLTVDTRYGI